MVSVIVPAYNAGPHLGAQLDALATQDYEGELEVIMADDGSLDGSMELAAQWSHPRIALRIVPLRVRRGPGAARNAGVRASRGDLLVFCDADDVASPGWIAAMVETARDADLIGGRLETARLNSPTVRASFEVTDSSRPHLGYLPVAAGANLAVWADVFASVGGFDESSRTGEDVAFCWRSQQLGYTLAASDAVMHKRLPHRYADAMRRFFHYGIGDAWLYRQFGPAGMPRRTRRSSLEIMRLLARGWPGEPAPLRRWHWVIVFALTGGRIVGSVRYRVIFT
jgi:glycosyltransferase involved in cell wall biosynthesis